MSIIKGMTIVFFNISSTSGRRKLLPDDVKIPENYKINELARLGSKAAFDPTSLRLFENVRREGKAYLSSVGIRHGGGYGVPTHKLAEIKDKFNELEIKFNMGKETVLSNYIHLRDSWFKEIEKINIEFAETIKSNVISKEYLESQINFRFYTEEDEERAAGSTLVNEVAYAAKEAIEHLVKKKETSSLHRRSLTLIVNIRDKLDSLSFLNGAVKPTIIRINNFLNSIPTQGTLGKEWLDNLVLELAFLSEPSNIDLLGHQMECDVSQDDVNSVVGSTAAPSSISESKTDDFLSLQNKEYLPDALANDKTFEKNMPSINLPLESMNELPQVITATNVVNNAWIL